MHEHDRHNTTILSVVHTCQLHVSANTIFRHHQVEYHYRRKLHNI